MIEKYISESWGIKLIEELMGYKRYVFVPKFKRFPKLCRKFNIGKVEYVPIERNQM